QHAALFDHGEFASCLYPVPSLATQPSSTCNRFGILKTPTIVRYRRGESPKKLDTVHVPAGLNIGAETPEEIALSIAAEIVSLRTEKLLAKNS
ncbi:MAG TPA: XdhC family protein, partial [Edaphobacter sp.]|nr:XdhC family protein [Edaphobacter sp.]